MNSIKIKIDRLEDAVDLAHQIPEFDNPYNIDEYKKRLMSDHLVLTAHFENEIVGFKIGYDRFNDGSFYSWMGGVLPENRNQSIAEILADYQENWAKINGYASIRLKTRKKHEAMLSFSKKRGFVITKEIEKIPKKESRTWMEKQL
jgi:ribosomal protein S18 acetylase RimI-like enzyme